MSRPALLACALLAAAPCAAQPAPLRDTLVVVDDAVRAQLAAEWDAQPIGSPERIYCALFRTDTAPSRTLLVYTVIAALPAIVERATWDGVVSRCPPAIVRGTPFRLTTLHTHPPFTCRERATLECRPGGPLAWLCEPSQTDVRTFRAQRYAFALVQCDRHAFVPWRAASAPPPPRSLWRRIWPDGTTVRAGAATLGAFAGGRIDRDAGGYTDNWRTADKREHALGGMALGAVTGWRAACLAGGAWEAGQRVRGGYASWRDATATCGGAVVADYLTRRFR